MARSSSGSAKVVTALTAAALAVVGFLAYQAAAAPDTPAKKHRAEQSTPPKKSERHEAAKGVPAQSGTGRRVVYALGSKRVWLVNPGDKVRRSYAVTPSNVSPSPGSYRVTSRSSPITGSDGVKIEHVVRFALVDGVAIGFSAAVDGSTPPPAKGTKTGGVRSSRADGAAMWTFGTVGTTVVVVK